MNVSHEFKQEGYNESLYRHRHKNDRARRHAKIVLAAALAPNRTNSNNIC